MFKKLSQTSEVCPICITSFIYLRSVNLIIDSHNKKRGARKDCSSQKHEFWIKRFVSSDTINFSLPANIHESIKHQKSLPLVS